MYTTLEEVAHTLKYAIRPRGRKLTTSEIRANKLKRDRLLSKRAHHDGPTLKRRAKDKVAKQSRKTNRS